MSLSPLLRQASKPWLNAATARSIVVVIVVLVLGLDYVTPAEYDVGLFYGVAIAMCAWSGSQRFLWTLTGLLTAFVVLGAWFGAAPLADWSIVWVDRSLTAFSLLLIAVVVHAWMTNMSTVETQRLLTKHLLETVELAQIIVRTVEGRVLFWSHGAELLYGWSAEEATGRSVQDLFRIDLGNAEFEEINRHLEQHWQWNGQIRHHRKDGTPIWVASQCTLDTSELYPHPVVTEVNNDITELMVAETRFRNLADLLPQLIWQVSLDGKIIYANQRWHEYFQRDPDQIVTSANGTSQLIHKDDVSKSLQRWNKAIQTGEMEACEIRYLRHDGVYRWFADQAVSVRNQAGRIIYWVRTATDIEEEVRARVSSTENS